MIIDQPLKTGQIVECRIAGLMEQFEDGQEDHNVLAILSGDSAAIGSGERERPTSFVLGVFEHVEGQRMKVGRFLGTTEAEAYVRTRLDHATEIDRTLSGFSAILPHIEGFDPGDQSEVEAFFNKAWKGSRFPFDPEGAHSDLRRIPAEYQANDGRFCPP